MRIERAQLREVTLPLTTPYELSFTTVTEIRSQIVLIRLADGRHGYGETVALPGYSRETPEEIRIQLEPVLTELQRLDVQRGARLVRERLSGWPFARSPVLTALEMAAGSFRLPPHIAVPLLAPLPPSRPEDLPDAVAELRKAGYRTIKVKIGRNVEADVRTAGALLEELPPDMRVRFDANGGFDVGAAERFLAALDHPRRNLVELVEQPLPADDWAGMRRLCAAQTIPLMLDEPIVTPDDVDRAGEIGAGFIKLKLFKNGSPGDLVALARQAAERGLGVVLGNGVSADIGCLAEAAVYAAHPELFSGAGEMNGFVKLGGRLLDAPPDVRHGTLRWEGSVAPGLTAAVVSS